MADEGPWVKEQPLPPTSVEPDKGQGLDGNSEDGDVTHPPPESSTPSVQSNEAHKSDKGTEQSYTDKPGQGLDGHNGDGDVTHPPPESSTPSVQSNEAHNSDKGTEQSYTDKPGQGLDGHSEDGDVTHPPPESSTPSVQSNEAHNSDKGTEQSYTDKPGHVIITSHQGAAARQQASQPSKLQVEFSLYVPEIEGHLTYGAILYVFENGQRMEYPLRAIDRTILWAPETPVYLAADRDTLYEYGVLYKPIENLLTTVGVAFHVTTLAEAFWVYQPTYSIHGTASIQRDVFDDPKLSYACKASNELLGKLYFTEDIFRDCVRLGNLKERLLEWEYLKFPNLSSKHKGQRKVIGETISKLCKRVRATWMQLYFLCVVLGKVSQRSGLRLEKLGVTKLDAKCLLRGVCKSARAEDIPSNCISGLQMIVPELLALAKQDEPWLWLLSNCSKLFDTIYLRQQATSGWFIECSKKRDPALFIQHSEPAVEALVQLQINGDPHSHHLLEALLREASDVGTKIAIIEVVAKHHQVENIQWVLEGMESNCLRSIEAVITSCSKPYKIEELYQLWIKLKVGRMGPLAQDKMATAVTLLASKFRYFSQSQADKLQKMMTDNMLFPCKKVPDLLKVVAKCKDQVLHHVFLTLARDEMMCLEVDKESAKKLSVMWLQNSIDAQCTTSTSKMSHDVSAVASTNIPGAYNELLKIVQTRLVGGDKTIEAALGYVVKGFIRKFGWKTLLAKSEGMKIATDRAQSLYKEHLEEMINQEGSGPQSEDLHEIASSMCDKPNKAPGVLNIKHGLTEDLLMILINFMDLPEATSDQDLTANLQFLLTVIEQSRFWLAILKAKGKTTKLQKHPTCKAVTSVLLKLGQKLQSGHINIQLFQAVVEKASNVKVGANMIALLIDATRKFAGKDSNSQPAKNLLRDTNQQLESHNQLLGSVHNLLNVFSTMVEDLIKIDDISSLQTDLHHQKKKFKEDKTLTVTDLSEATYWGKLYDLKEPARRLDGFQKSYVFRNVLRKHFAERSWEEDGGKDDESSENSEKNKPEENKPEENEPSVAPGAAATYSNLSTPQTIPMKQFASTLSEDVVDQFEKQCKPLTKCDSKILLGTVDFLFTGITEADKMGIEISHLDMLLSSNIPDSNKKALKEFLEFPKTQHKVQNLSAVLKLFHVSVKSTGDLCTALQLCEKGVDQETSLSELHKAVDKVEKIIRKLSEEDNAIIEQLSRSSELLAFLRDIVDEDLRNLIDAVEEHSEQFVNESTVSNLIEVKRYLQPLIKTNFHNNPESFILKVKHYHELSIRNLPEKINDCSINFHSLKGLYASVANRGEMTKEIAHNAYMKGHYTFHLNTSSTCNVTMSYDRGKTQASHSMSDLRHFRSRALLIVNSDKDLPCPPGEVTSAVASDLAESSTELSYFITCIDLASSIATLCESLHSSGHFKYRTFQMSVSNIDELKDLDARLQHDYKNWQKTLKRARRDHYYLNYLYSDQLWTLDDFFNGHHITPDLSSLFHFIHPLISVNEDLRKKYTPPQKVDDPYKRLCQIGSAMDKICGNLKAPKRQMKWKQKQQAPSTTTSSTASLRTLVQPGKVFVAALDVTSSQVVNVIMNLYESTTGSFPEPHQIIICSPDTKWEELHLLLQRCVGAPNQPELGNCLFCIANVELLRSDIQFRLVDEIKQLHSLDSPFLMALICRGGTHHPILDQFSRLTHGIQGKSDFAMRQCFSALWPNVKIVTSDIPGLGKTEFVQDQASKKGMGVVSFPIGGTITRNYMVRRLANLEVKPYQVLHLDISHVDDPQLLDAFIFELIVVGAVHSGTNIVRRPTEHIIMEVANTLSHALRNRLVTSMCFEQVHLMWENYQNLIVSQEVNSPAQVVCHYLDALDRATIDEIDIPLSGPKTVVPLPAKRCKDLLRKYFSTGADLSFTILEIFLSVLADQLKKFSASLYFRTANLLIMLGDEHEHQVRRNLFTALLDVSKEFASRSVLSCRSTQSTAMTQEQAVQKLQEATSTTSSVMQMLSRVEGMIRWADSNHLMVLFHSQNAQTVSALYRSLQQVPVKIRDLFKQQVNQPLPDFPNLTQGELQMILERIARTTSHKLEKEGTGTLDRRYALTPDNILKMALVIMRVRAHIPVIIMGETGCGKTSLIRYLAKTCQVPFKVLSIHAGVTEDKITSFVTDRAAEARTDLSCEVWAFLDEINTCDHLGLINEIICHHSMLGKKLPENLFLLAACNPYRQRDSSQLHTSGLEGKFSSDESSKLVYRVHPLPESMLDYVWDYGTLDETDERSYITQMVTDVFSDKSLVKSAMLVDLLSSSQNFIRRVEGNQFSVSLRDVNRCRVLMRWFVGTLKTKGEKAFCEQTEHQKKSKHAYNDVDVRSVILTLAHCYHSRLAASDDRAKYRKELSEVMKRHNIVVFDKEIKDVIHEEQLDILDRMELPEGTAKNAALCENVFVLLVCILNKIPVFVVGKPGCSKSLSMQLIRSNLRGRDSSNKYFKTLPQLYVVSHQGSESSTSEGIIKVFDKAKKYKEHNEGGVLPVVLLDEIGLAEVSRYNPLKVLHSLLEPAEDEFPEVAVVGISNWALDAAKMNRVIHLSRPEPDKNDLCETGKSLAQAALERSCPGGKLTSPQDKALKALAEAYFEYEEKQTYRNFHGLRDYYSLIKCICLPEHINTGDVVMPQFNLKVLKRGLLRNFGGLPTERDTIMKTFQQKLKALHIDLDEDTEDLSVIQLIKDNLRDKQARHLMLITSGDSAVGILEQMIRDSEDLNCREQVTIFGSHLDDDLSENYDYRTLSRIILCMERGCILILRDLESIYGSLYDMLNQNYTVVGKKRNCRVALGAYSNPMCQVHENFRCIVLIDQQKVNYSDPPFLNRFEKQLLRFSDVINYQQISAIKKLQCWVDDISKISGQQFTKEDLFIGFHDDTLPSLVLWHSNHGQDLEQKELLTRCKADLMWIASPDGMLRASKSGLAKTRLPDIVILQQEYFNQPTHGGLKKFMEHMLLGEGPVPTAGQDATTESGEHPDMYPMQPLLKLVIHTFSNVHTDLAACLQDFIKNHTGMAVSEGLQIEKLSAFKSEKQMSSTIQHFWLESKAPFLILQCSPALDGAHMLLAKSQLDHYRNEYIKARETTMSLCDKHVCLLIHIEQGKEVEESPWQLNFLCGWKQVTLDRIEESALPIKELLSMTVREVLESTVRPFADVAREQLMWCFTCFKYRNEGRPVEGILNLVSAISESPTLMELLKQHVYTSAPCFSEQPLEGDTDSWQVQVACDRQLLHSCSGLQTAMQQFISLQVRQPLAKTIFLIESQSAWESFFNGSPELQSVWIELALNGDTLNFDGCQGPRGPESCDLPEVYLDLKFPFSLHFLAQLEKQKDLFFDEMRQLQQEEDNFDEDGFLKQKEAELQVHRFVDTVDRCIPDVFQRPALCNHLDLLIDDFCNLMSKDHGSRLKATVRTKVLRGAIAQRAVFSKRDSPQLTITDVVTCYWRNNELFSNELQLISSCVNVVKLDDLLATVMGSEPEPTMAESAMEVQLGSLDDSESFIEKAEEVGLLATVMEATVEPSEQTPESVNVEDISVVLLPDETTVTSLLALDDDLADEGKALNVHKEKLEDSEQTPTEPNYGEESYECPDGGFEESSTISKRLVEVYCTALLPEKSLIDSCGGLEAWHAKVTTLLSLAAKVSTDSPMFHFLRLCNDYSTILNFASEGAAVMNKLAQVAKSEGDNCMNSESMFSLAVDTARRLLNRGEISSEQTQQFLCLLFGRCLDADPDTDLIDSILNELSKLPTGSIRYAGPVLDRIFWFGQGSHPTESNCTMHLGLFQEAIEHQDLALEEHPPLQSLNNCLQSLQSTAGFDSHLATLCSDIIQDRYFSSVANAKAKELGNPDNPMFAVLVRAAKVIRESATCDLQFICSVAFIRAFLTGIAGALQGMLNTQGGEMPEVSEHLLKEVNTQLFTPSPKHEPTLSRKTSMILFFLKQFRPDHGLLGLRDVSRDLGLMLPALQELEWEKHGLKSRFPFGPLRYATGYKDALKAALALMEREDGAMNALIQKAKGCAETRFSLLATLYDLYFLVRTVRPAQNTEKVAAETIAKMMSQSDLPRPYELALLCAVGEQDSQLCVSEQTSLDEILKKSVIMHLLCVLSSSLTQNMTIQSTFQQYLINPEKLNAPYVLAIDNNAVDPPKVYTATNQQMWDEKAAVWCCSCGSLVAQQSLAPTCIEQQMMCPVCKSLSVPTNHFEGSQPSQSFIQNISSGGDVTQQTGYIVANPETRGGKWNTVRQLSPAAYRCLHLLVHGCLLAGHYAEVCKPEQLGEFIFKDHDKGQEAIDICTKFVDVDWKALGEVISGTSEDVCRLLHSVIQHTNSLLNGSHKAGQNSCNTLEEREKWEEKFSAVVDDLVKRIPASLREQQVSAVSEDIEIEQGPKCLEIKVEELERGVDRKYHHDHALRLFRVTEMRTFEKLHCHFMNGGRDLQDTYPFLGLFFSMHEQLPYIKHLHPLLKWTTIVKARLSHRLAKEKAKGMYICDFIYDSKLTKQEKDYLKKSFQEFKEAWNQIHGSGKAVDDRFASMPPMHEQRLITQCLLDPQIPGGHLQAAISVLYNLQNKFLTNVAKLAATTTCPAVSFLVREQHSGVIPQVSILDVKKKDVIHYTWSNDFMKHSECNTEYGLGRQLFFDFSKIEMELANTLVLGKAYINEEQGLPKFAYANELFSASASILHDVCNHVPQEPLATDTVSTLRENNESDRIAKPLLEHMEVVLFLLKRTKGNPSEPLVDYTKKWLSMLTSPFPANLLPEPHSAIQLKHVVHLYETLEDMMADVTIESLHDCFRQTLKPVMLSKMENATTEELERAVKVTRQFVFRYMSSSDSAEKVKPGSLLLTHLVNTGLWTADQKETSEDTATIAPSTFMDQMNVEHVFAALEAMKSTTESRRQRERNMFGKYTAKTHQTSNRRAKMKKMKYSKT